MMSDEEMMQATLAGAGPRPVAAGRVRRKRTLVAAPAAESPAMKELVSLKEGAAAQ